MCPCVCYCARARAFVLVFACVCSCVRVPGLAPSQPALRAEYEEVMGLFAFPAPADSPLGHLLSAAHRAATADAVNAALLKAEGQQADTGLTAMLRRLKCVGVLGCAEVPKGREGGGETRDRLLVPAPLVCAVQPQCVSVPGELACPYCRPHTASACSATVASSAPRPLPIRPRALLRCCPGFPSVGTANSC
jgi:hypothetical protein